LNDLERRNGVTS